MAHQNIQHRCLHFQCTNSFFFVRPLSEWGSCMNRWFPSSICDSANLNIDLHTEIEWHIMHSSPTNPASQHCAGHQINSTAIQPLRYSQLASAAASPALDPGPLGLGGGGRLGGWVTAGVGAGVRVGPLCSGPPVSWGSSGLAAWKSSGTETQGTGYTHYTQGELHVLTRARSFSHTHTQKHTHQHNAAQLRLEEHGSNTRLCEHADTHLGTQEKCISPSRITMGEAVVRLIDMWDEEQGDGEQGNGRRTHGDWTIPRLGKQKSGQPRS